MTFRQVSFVLSLLFLFGGAIETASAQSLVVMGYPVTNPVVQKNCVFASQCAGSAGEKHTGMDFTSSDKNVYAAAPGKVVLMQVNGVGCSCNGPGCGCQDHGLGNAIILQHTRQDGSSFYTLYGHNASFAPNLAVGQTVAKGAIIATMGASGYGKSDYWDPDGTGPLDGVHSHFEVKSAQVLGSTTSCSTCFGYTPGDPTAYGYSDPAQYINIVSVRDSQLEESEYFRLIKYPETGCRTEADCVPLILIHGIHGTGVDPGCEIGASAKTDCYWWPLINYLQQQNAIWSQTQLYIYRYLSDKGKTTLDMGQALRREVDTLGLKVPAIIVAHSMGGIVARTFMNHRPGPGLPRGYDLVYGVITLATPHHGSPMANLDWRNWTIQRVADSNPLLPCEGCVSVLLFNSSDWFYWVHRNRSSGLDDNSGLANRSDLVWDNYDGFFDPARDALSDRSWEQNVILWNLRTSQDARKLIVYGGYLDPSQRGRPLSEAAATSVLNKLRGWVVLNGNDRAAVDHEFLEATAGMLLNSLGKLTSSDGFVPLDSALFNRNPYPAARRIFPNYDHQDMRGNDPELDARSKYNDDLFSALAIDIRSILALRGVPPVLVSLAVQPSPVTSGTTARLAYNIRNNNDRALRIALKAGVSGIGNKGYCDVQLADAPPGQQTVYRELRIPSGLENATATIQGEVWPGSEPDPCGTSPTSTQTSVRTIQVGVLAAPVGTLRPAISLSLAAPVKQEYQTGDTIRLLLKTTAGQGNWRISTFLWVEGPGGRRYWSYDGQGMLKETTAPVPVTVSGPAIDYTAELPPIAVTPALAAGNYTWRAAFYSNEIPSASNLIAESNTVSYRVASTRPAVPSISSVRTSLALYRSGDYMTVFYTTWQGSTSAPYDLMLRVTSRATGNDYYFYDDRSDDNRWIHRSARAMLTEVPRDGSFQIPYGNLPPIVIDRDAPSGQYILTAYFSLPGRNTQTGNSAQTQFTLDTPTAEGGCFIATAAFGSAMAPAVEELRRFRDRFLVVGPWGRLFVNWYYRASPSIARAIKLHPAWRKAVRIVLWPAVVFAALTLRSGLLPAVIMFVVVFAAVLILFRRASLLVRIATLVLVAAAAAAAADVQGTVVRSRPFPVAVAGVRMELEQTGQIAASGQDGGFIFRGVSAGQYSLKASAPGYFTSAVRFAVGASASVVKVVAAIEPIGSRTYEYYLPHTAETDGWWTFFNLLNPNYTSADVTMAAYDASGIYLGLSAKLSRLNINQQVSGKPSDFFPSGVIANAAWYKFTSSAPLSGFEIFGHSRGTLAAFSLPTGDSNQMYLPHVAHDAQWWTGLSLVSAGVQSSEVHLEAHDASGAWITDAGGLGLLSPGEKTVNLIDDYFGWDFPLDIQWARVRSDAPISGFELFGTRDLAMLAAVPGLSRGAKQFYFLHLATDNGWWTGIVMLNTQARAGTVRMTAYGSNGNVLAVSRSIRLQAGERLVGVAESFFDTWPAGVSYIAGAADVDIVGCELVGRFTPPLFGGLPAVASSGPELAYSYAISTSEWETTVGILNASPASTQVTLQAMSSDGRKVAETKFTLPGKGYRMATLRSLFGTVPSNTAWAQAFTSGAPLTGFLKLARVREQQFTDIPADPIVPANQVGQTSTFALSSGQQEIARAVFQVEAEPVAEGLRLDWRPETEPVVRALAGGQLRTGDIIVEVEGDPIRTRKDLWVAYQKWQSKQRINIVIRRSGEGAHAVQLINPKAKIPTGK